MNNKRRNMIFSRLLVFAAAVLTIFYLLPREERSKYTYEENRPWNYQLLTAPFDVPVYLDTLRAQAIKDSIDRVFEPIFKRDPQTEARRIAGLQTKLASMGTRLSAAQRQLLVREIRAIYERGIIDMETFKQLNDGTIAGLRMLTDNVARSMPRGRLFSSRTAYNHLDSIVRAANMHDALIASSLNEVLIPNLIPDTVQSARFRDEAYQSALAPIGVVQQGERIIDKGDIVTPQLYTVLRTYETLAAARGAEVGTDRYYTAAGQVLYIVLLLGALWLYIWFFRHNYYRDLRKLTLVTLLVAAFTGFAELMPSTWLSGIYVVPFTTLIIVIVVFLDSRTAFFAYLTTILLSMTVARFPLEFVVVEFIAGIVSLVSIRDLSRRSQLLRTALMAFVSYCVSFTAVEMMLSGAVARLSGDIFGGFAVNAVMISFAYVLIFIFEKVFGFTSKVTLVELSDINNPLLRELSEECPGTFQHSMAVSNLATVAARRIGADVQLVRTGALYHDIGKLANPVFFTENQHGVNPHDGLDPRQSAAIVISHVNEGLERAERAKLPSVVRDFISEHHGRGKARYFYTTYCNAHPDEEVDPKPFTYPGPNPHSRETSILMMADAVEAASRSLKDHSPESIAALVNRIIDSQISEGLHNDSTLEFRDVKAIKDSFITRLRTIYHARVSYPEQQNKQEKKEPSDDSAVNNS